MVDIVNKELNDFGQLYKRYQNQDRIARQLLQGQHRYFINLDFDPLTGDALPQRMSYWLSQNIHTVKKTELYDRFTYLVDYCVDAINNILVMPRQTVIRIHEMTPVYLAQRLDSRSVQWLSRKPGNNLREKLAANPHILAATRKMSFDTLENRLLKAFLIRVRSILLDRQEAGIRLNEHQESFIDSIQKTLQQQEFIEIKPWQHIPPNNVLLQDRQYRKVWRAWQLLNRLEEDCEYQQKTSIAYGFGFFGELLRQLASLDCCLLLDQAWQFKLGNLSVNQHKNVKEQNLVEVIVIVLGNDKKKSQAKITPKAKLLLTLSVKGDINIQRQVLSKSQNWQINFRQVNGLVEVRLSSNFKSYNQGKAWQPAMPDMFSQWGKILVSELLPGEINFNLKQLVKTQSKILDDFVSLRFDGASCELQTKAKKAYRTAPLFIDIDGLNCSYSRALSVNEKVFSVIELSRISDDRTHHLGSLSDLLAKQIQAKKGMYYLVSDHHSDFETSNLRREINRNFNNAAPLPKSIAAIYAVLEKKQFKHNDLIMVLGSDLDGVYVTPVYYRWHKETDEGYLERHPSIKLSEQGEKQVLQQALVKSGLSESIAKRFIELYSYNELVSGKAKLTLNEGEYWYQVPVNLKVDNIDISEILLRETNKLQRKPEKIYFLSVSSAVKRQKGLKSTQWLSSDPLSGSQRLLELQYKQPHKIFWKDHLPQLMTRLPVEGIEQDFYFVGSRTSVKPERGKAVDIPIEQSFTLPSGKEEIRFTVYQGEGSNRQAFSLLLSLPQPLKTDCKCKLELTYIYGDEQPYKLRFIPNIPDNKPFNYIDAQWGRKQDNIDNRVVAIPAFPKRLEFEKLREYSGEDIIDWLECNIEQLDNIYNFILFGKSNKRFNFAYKDIRWVNNREFGFYDAHPDYQSIFVHKSKFENLDIENENYFSGEVFIEDKNKFSLRNIAPNAELTKYELNGLIKSWRFPMLTFSDQGRCFDDEDIPTDFAKKGKQAIEQSVKLLELRGIHPTLEKELMQFLSYCHKLMPQPIANKLLQAVTDKKQVRQEKNWFKYALGDVSQEWQKRLFQELLKLIDDRKMLAVILEILSVAMWREQSVVEQLTVEQIRILTNKLNGCLLDDIEKLKKKDNHFKWNSFVLRLEFLLALIRTRNSSDDKISSLFALDSDLSKQLLSTVEKITDKQGEALAYQLQQPRVVARVKLSVNKPESYYRTPDLLYALKLYLSGDDGADKITITELVNE